jgi:hypothetical protein
MDCYLDEPLFRKAFERAHAAGLSRDFAILAMSVRSAVARELHLSVFGKAMPEVDVPGDDGGRGEPIFVTCLPIDALRPILKECGRPGAQVVAQCLEDHTIGAQYWLVVILAAHIELRGYGPDGLIWFRELPHDRVRRSDLPPAIMAQDPGPSMAPVHCDGKTMMVFGKTGLAAMQAAAIVQLGLLVSRPGLTDAGRQTGSCADDDSFLGGLIGVLAADNPAVVAEAIRSLRRDAPHAAARVEAVLQRSPELGELSQAVHQDLASREAA